MFFHRFLKLVSVLLDSLIEDTQISTLINTIPTSVCGLRVTVQLTSLLHISGYFGYVYLAKPVPLKINPHLMRPPPFPT